MPSASDLSWQPYLNMDGSVSVAVCVRIAVHGRRGRALRPAGTHTTQSAIRATNSAIRARAALYAVELTERPRTGT